jgi:hypothetical protein
MHVFVHHPLTQTYEYLRLEGASSREKFSAEFSTAVSVHALAHQHELSLEGHAKVEMARLNKELPFSVAFDLIQSGYPDSRADEVLATRLLQEKYQLSSSKAYRAKDPREDQNLHQKHATDMSG